MKITPHSPETARRFGRTYILRLQRPRINKPSKRPAEYDGMPSSVSAGFLLGLFLDSEDGGNIFLRNVFLRTTWRFNLGDRAVRNLVTL
jgi:hypothetical protein